MFTLQSGRRLGAARTASGSASSALVQESLTLCGLAKFVGDTRKLLIGFVIIKITRPIRCYKRIEYIHVTGAIAISTGADYVSAALERGTRRQTALLSLTTR